MTEIILYLWVVTSGDIALTQIPGFRTMDDCIAAREVFLMDNPAKVSDVPFGMVGKCVEVPK